MVIRRGENKFYIGAHEDEPDAWITFNYVGEDKLVVDHTFVSESLRGQKIAAQLVERVISHARKEDRKIIPECSYVEKYLETHEEHKDILADS